MTQRSDVTSPPPTFDGDDRQEQRSAITLVLSVLFLVIIVIGGLVSWFVLQGRDDENTSSGDVSAPSSTTAPVTQPGLQTAPDNDVDLAALFGTPTTDIRGRRLDVPKNPLGQILPQSEAGGQSSTRGSQAALSDAPRGLMWQQVYSVPMPFSTSDGPTAMTQQGTPSGFSDTPQGATLAAWQYAWRLAAGNRQVRQEILDTATILEPAHADSQRRAFLSLSDQLGAEQVAMFNDIPKAVQVASFDDDVATVRFGFPLVGDGVDPSDPGGTFQTLTVIRRNGDWKLALKGERGQVEWGRTISFEDWGHW